MDKPVTLAFTVLCKSFASQKNKAVNPALVLKQLSHKWPIYKRLAQQDSHEVLRRLLDSMNDEWNKNVNESKIETIFKGELVSSILCRVCNRISTSVEPFLDLSLPIRESREIGSHLVHSLSQSLMHVDLDTDNKVEKSFGDILFTSRSRSIESGIHKLIEIFLEKEELESTAWKCEHCEQQRKRQKVQSTVGMDDVNETEAPEKKIDSDTLHAWKKYSISSLPRILVIQLKRFTQTGNFGRTIKVDDMVSFPDVLELGDLLLDPTLANLLKQDGSVDANTKFSRTVTEYETKYMLYGLVVHSGSLSSGHYIAYVEVGALWYYCSDSYVKRVVTEEVFSSKPYLLFYEAK